MTFPFDFCKMPDIGQKLRQVAEAKMDSCSIDSKLREKIDDTNASNLQNLLTFLAQAPRDSSGIVITDLSDQKICRSLANSSADIRFKLKLWEQGDIPLETFTERLSCDAGLESAGL